MQTTTLSSIALINLSFISILFQIERRISLTIKEGSNKKDCKSIYSEVQNRSTPFSRGSEEFKLTLVRQF